MNIRLINRILVTYLLLSILVTSNAQISTNQGFEILGNVPSDTRNTLTTLGDTSNVVWIYPGLLSYAVDQDQFWYHNGSYWSLFAQGGGLDNFYLSNDTLYSVTTDSIYSVFLPYIDSLLLADSTTIIRSLISTAGSQYIDTLLLQGDTLLKASIFGDGIPALEINLSPLKDNLGNHTMTQNLQTNGNWISGDGGNEGIGVDADGKIGVGTLTPSYILDINSSNSAVKFPVTTSLPTGTPGLLTYSPDSTSFLAYYNAQWNRLVDYDFLTTTTQARTDLNWTGLTQYTYYTVDASGNLVNGLIVVDPVNRNQRIGEFAGNSSVTYQNAIGWAAGVSATAIYQNAIGREAGRYNTGGNQNAFGWNAGQYNTGQSQNAFGRYAGRYNTGGYQNAFGDLAGSNNSGEYQNAFGRQAGQYNTNWYQNAFGWTAGTNNTGVSQNAFGTLAGYLNTGANQNAFGPNTGEYNNSDFMQGFGTEIDATGTETTITPTGYDYVNNRVAGNFSGIPINRVLNFRENGAGTWRRFTVMSADSAQLNYDIVSPSTFDLVFPSILTSAIGIGRDIQLTTSNALVISSPAGMSMGIEVVSPTARLHLPAGTATANTSPLKFTPGTNLPTPEAGAVEWDGTNLFITQTTGPTRKQIAYTTDIVGDGNGLISALPAGDIAINAMSNTLNINSLGTAGSRLTFTDNYGELATGSVGTVTHIRTDASGFELQYDDGANTTVLNGDADSLFMSFVESTDAWGYGFTQSGLTIHSAPGLGTPTWYKLPFANPSTNTFLGDSDGDGILEFISYSGFLTSEVNDLSSVVTWANVPDANITQSSVTQHQAALSITESQISDLAHTPNQIIDTLSYDNVTGVLSASLSNDVMGLATVDINTLYPSSKVYYVNTNGNNVTAKQGDYKYQFADPWSAIDTAYANSSTNAIQVDVAPGTYTFSGTYQADNSTSLVQPVISNKIYINAPNAEISYISSPYTTGFISDMNAGWNASSNPVILDLNVKKLSMLNPVTSIVCPILITNPESKLSGYIGTIESATTFGTTSRYWGLELGANYVDLKIDTIWYDGDLAISFWRAYNGSGEVANINSRNMNVDLDYIYVGSQRGTIGGVFRVQTGNTGSNSVTDSLSKYRYNINRVDVSPTTTHDFLVDFGSQNSVGIVYGNTYHANLGFVNNSSFENAMFGFTVGLTDTMRSSTINFDAKKVIGVRGNLLQPSSVGGIFDDIELNLNLGDVDFDTSGMIQFATSSIFNSKINIHCDDCRTSNGDAIIKLNFTASGNNKITISGSWWNNAAQPVIDVSGLAATDTLILKDLKVRNDGSVAPINSTSTKVVYVQSAFDYNNIIKDPDITFTRLDEYGINNPYGGDHGLQPVIDSLYSNIIGGGGGASQLSDLTDVVSATNTNRFALMANGTTGYVGRALVQADVSDLNLTSREIALGTGSGITSESGFKLRENGVLELSADNGTGNVGISSVGGAAMGNIDALSDFNVAIGFGAMAAALNNADNNVALGPGALFSLTTGDKNTGAGPYAGADLTTGSDNFFGGYFAGDNATVLGQSVNIGSYAGYLVTSSNGGIGGTKLGYYAGGGSISDYLVSVGHNSGTSSSNTNYLDRAVAVGALAGSNLGVNNARSIFMGFSAGNGESTYDDLILIGSEASATQSNQIVIGHESPGYESTQLKVRNYKFNIDQTLGAGQDGYVMTYNNSSGEFEAQSSSSYAEMYINLTDPDTINFAGISDSLITETTAGELDNFTHSNGRLTYTGSATIKVVVRVSASFTYDNIGTLGLLVYKNGTYQEKSRAEHNILSGEANSARIRPISTNCILTLSQNDYVEVGWETNTAGSTVLTTEDLNVIVTKL